MDDDVSLIRDVFASIPRGLRGLVKVLDDTFGPVGLLCLALLVGLALFG